MKKDKNFDYDKKKPNPLPKSKVSKGSSSNQNTQQNILQVEGNSKANKEQTVQNPSSILNDNSQLSQSNYNNKSEVQSLPLSEHNEEPLLPDTEMLPYPDYPPENKSPSVAFGKSYLADYLDSLKNEVPNEVINGVDNCLNAVLSDIKDAIIKSNLQINSENGNITTLIETLSKEVKREIDIEEAIKRQKLKELEESKANLQKKIIKLDENLKILDSTVGLDGNNSLVNPSDQVEENIKKSQLKEIKNTKEVLTQKLEGIEEQVQKLMASEEQMAQLKKLNIL